MKEREIIDEAYQYSIKISPDDILSIIVASNNPEAAVTFNAPIDWSGKRDDQ